MDIGYFHSEDQPDGSVHIFYRGVFFEEYSPYSKKRLTINFPVGCTEVELDDYAELLLRNKIDK